MHKKQKISWHNFDELIALLVANIRGSGKNYDFIFGVPRGGLAIALTLSHHLNLPLLATQEEITSETLIVDDINDSGKTRDLFPDNDFAVLIERKGEDKTPSTYIGKVIQSTEWLVFPWELDSEEEVVDNTFKRK